MPNPNIGMPLPNPGGLYGAASSMPQPGGGYHGNLSFGVSIDIGGPVQSPHVHFMHVLCKVKHKTIYIYKNKSRLFVINN